MRNFCNGIGDLNTPYCDAEHGRKGRVKRKDVHHGYPLADTEVRAENQRGELTVTNGLATVMLPSKDIDTRYFKDAAGFELGLPTVRQVTIAFGDTPLADRAHEINVFCAGGEDYLMPDGLTPEKHPLRPPVKVYGHFAGFMGGTSALCATLAAPLAQQMLSTVDLPGIGAAQILTAPFRYPQLLLRVTRAAAAMGVDRTIKNINKNIYLWYFAAWGTCVENSRPLPTCWASPSGSVARALPTQPRAGTTGTYWISDSVPGRNRARARR